MRLLQQLQGGLVVACEALPGEPLHGSAFMTAMAVAAVRGGAQGLLANGPAEIAAIRAKVPLPLLGVLLREYPGSRVRVTPTLAEVAEVVDAGAQLVGIDATERWRPEGESLPDLVRKVRARYPDVPLMAEVATVREAALAQELGFDCVSSGLYGFTRETAGRHLCDDDFEHLRALRAAVVRCPLVAEGAISTPAQAARTLRLGSDLVVVGSAITRPQFITATFAKALRAR
ncbi:N-acetylmannosamine-6-phosphate 2-epimerase [Myxococcus faecalis]|uniref:N-acetylmannosamine-6-phosphate 2-epimerase n=1 Tax=Myxococcus faecalis TaxID=3115646 RepID=UPI0024C9D8C3|nr:N-acetylmannosamine-6-phosphate 2-epimerase [Myxococcus sp. MH1]